MSESKYLKWQDKNGDKLLDICEDLIQVTESKKCPTCTPSATASVPNWKEQPEDEPWLNGKNCKYQTTIKTSYDSLVPDENATNSEASEWVEQIFSEHIEQAIDSLFFGFNKADTEESRQVVRDLIEFTKHDLDPRPFSKVKVLYSVPYDEFNTLPESVPGLEPDEDEDNEEDNEDQSLESTLTPRNMTIFADDFVNKIRVVSQGIYLYNSYYKIYRSIDKGNLIFEKTNKIVNLDGYGHFFAGTSVMLSLLNDLDDFLNKQGMNIVGNIGGTWSFSNDRVAKLEFSFSNDYKLNKLRVWTENCGNAPKTYDRKKLHFLLQKDSYKSPTALAYLSKLSDMEADLTARTPSPWIDFIKKYTYPKVIEQSNFGGIGIASAGDIPAAASCVKSQLLEGGKQLGQDVLDDAFGMVDAIAYQFHKNICKKSLGEETDERAKLGIVFDPNAGVEGENKNFFAFAEEQAFKQLTEEKNFCTLMLGSAASGMPPKDLTQFYESSLAELKLCGLTAIFLELTSCLMKQLSFEEAMSRILEAALRGMSWENFDNLFVGLPPGKQSEIATKARTKLSSGDLFARNTSAQAISDTGEGMPGTPLTATQLSNLNFPWLRGNDPRDQDLTSQASTGTATDTEDIGDPRYMTSAQLQAVGKQRATLVQQYEGATGSGLSNDRVWEAYIKAILETYISDPLSLFSRLEKMPGGQMMARVLASLDCPRPPVLDPSFTDWIKDIQLPFCRDTIDIYFPVIQNPYGWMPKAKDIWSVFWDAVVLALQKAIVSMLMKLMVKLCQTLGNAACESLSATGALVAGGFGMGSRDTFTNIVRDYLCDGQADADTVSQAITELMSDLGPGAAAMSNEADTINFAEDISSATSRKEMTDAFLGNPSDDFSTIVDEIIDSEYPDFREGLPDKQSIGNFFKDMGNVLPPEAKQAMQDFVDMLPEDDIAPASPSLCASPDQLEDFCELRADLLKGRATSSQIRQLCNQAQDDLGEQLSEAANTLQDPTSPFQDMPPLVSDPGCDNGIIPFMTEEAAAVAGGTLSDNLEQLKMAYTTDMLGNGPFEKDWGFLNLVLSDTQGYPYSVHVRKENFWEKYVDFFTDVTDSGLPWQTPRPTGDQRGAFPQYIAEWLKDSLADLSFTFNATNDFQVATSHCASFEELGFENMFGSSNVNLINLGLPDYNVIFTTNYADKSICTLTLGRKKTPDTSLLFYDNNSGRTGWRTGFQADLFLSDLKSESPNVPVRNVGNNNARIAIYELINEAQPNDNNWTIFTDESVDDATEEEQVTKNLKYEFISTDDTFLELGITPSDYSRFVQSFTKQTELPPQVELLRDLIEKNTEGDIESELVVDMYNSFMKNFITAISSEVSKNEKVFEYGAALDELTKEQFEYVVKDGQTLSPAGTPYSEATIKDPETGQSRSIQNSDRILGVSYDEYVNGTEARVVYLNPVDYGGSYLSPPFYVHPAPAEGWMAMVRGMFPDIGPCKPKTTDFVDFEDIEDRIQEVYSNLPEDERLMSDPECVIEVPYNRILERYSAAGIESVITATLRIFISMHMLKSLSAFLTFKPNFNKNYSSLYASYLIEVMEQALKDTSMLDIASFKDDEFWYAFLEQAVQTYSRRVDDGSLINPSSEALEACMRLNQMQQNYPFYRQQSLKDAIEIGDERGPYWLRNKTKALQQFKEEQVFERVMLTQEDAKTVLKDLVIEQLEYMSEKLLNNVAAIDLEPTYNDINFYFLQNFVQGGEELDLDKEMIEEVSDIGTVDGDYLYTTGGELSVAEIKDSDSGLSVGDEYSGYYHTHIDENDGTTLYMVGEFHTDEPHDLLSPFAGKVSVPMGDVASFPFIPDDESDKIFTIEKYISVEGTKMNPDEAVELIRSQGTPSDNISDVYPGTLKTVADPSGEIIGIVGQLGVRYGVQFSVIVNGTKYELTSAEIDALDVKLSQMPNLEGNSKTLLCLLNVLINESIYKTVTRYIFPLNKVTSLTAIYADMAFLSSIGEVTVPAGDTIGNLNYATKPGMKAKELSESHGDGGMITTVYGNDQGWANYADRSESGFAPWNWGSIQWDNWDRETLINSRRRLKKLFTSYYNVRDFRPGDPMTPKSERPGRMFVKNLRSVFTPAPGRDVVPWYKKRKLRSNPYNSNGVLCSKEDSDE